MRILVSSEPAFFLGINLFSCPKRRALWKCRLMLRNVDGTDGSHSFERESSKTSTNCSTRLFAVKSSLPTVTRTGSRWNDDASLRTASGQVALNINVCLSSPCTVWPMIDRISFSNPLSSILSASSSTRYRTLLKSHTPSLIRSRIRPGVPTMMRVVFAFFFPFSLARLRRASICPRLSTPPNTATLAMPKGSPSAPRVS